jgi:hypothetical protein
LDKAAEDTASSPALRVPITRVRGRRGPADGSPPAPRPCAIVRAVTRLHRGPSRPSALVLAAVAGCGVAQRPSVKVVDPALVAEGTALERERHRGGFALGPYVVRDSAARSEAPDPDGPLASEDVHRPVTQHRAGLTLEASEAGRTWTTTCTLQRRAPEGADYRAVLDENGDEVAVECLAKPQGLPPWRFHARALLSSNFVGELGLVGEPAWKVEILTRAIYVKRLERVLPVPVAQLRREGKAVVSVLLGRPERAWVAKDLEPLTTEAALALLLTLRLLPWELAE